MPPIVENDALYDIDRLFKEIQPHHIVVYNDDVNTFDHVIKCFRIILGHSSEQAEQCAIIINDKGSCSVKKGSTESLTAYNDALHDAGIDSHIEEIC